MKTDQGTLFAIMALSLYALIILGVSFTRLKRLHHTWQMALLVAISKAYTGLMFKQRIHQSHPFPPGGTLVLVNHRSPVDPMLILSSICPDREHNCLRFVEFLTAREYTTLGGPIGWICKHMRTIPVDRDGRDMESAREALRRLQQERVVGVFPEGRINFGEGLLPAVPGTAWIALKARKPVIPVYIHNAPQSRNMVEPFIKRCQVKVTFGAPLDMSRFEKARMTPALLDEVSDYLMRALARTGGYELADDYQSTRMAIPHPEPSHH